MVLTKISKEVPDGQRACQTTSKRNHGIKKMEETSLIDAEDERRIQVSSLKK